MPMPPDITARRFQVGFLYMARSSSPGSSSSSAVIPAMSQNPPSGSALSPYSVSPRRKEKILGPKPMKYRRTFMPVACATHMCPAS